MCHRNPGGGWGGRGGGLTRSIPWRWNSKAGLYSLGKPLVEPEALHAGSETSSTGLMSGSRARFSPSGSREALTRERSDCPVHRGGGRAKLSAASQPYQRWNHTTRASGTRSRHQGALSAQDTNSVKGRDSSKDQRHEDFRQGWGFGWGEEACGLQGGTYEHHSPDGSICFTEPLD